VKTKTPQFQYDAWLAAVHAAAKADSRKKEDVAKYRAAEYGVLVQSQYWEVKVDMKLAPGYPATPTSRDQSPGHDLRTKKRLTSLAVFTVEYLAKEDMIFTELYYRSLGRKK